MQFAGCRIAVSYEPSTRAGGDYSDFFALPDGHVGILVADVSGHGASAVVVMAMMRVLFHRGELWPPERALSLANRGAVEHILREQFVTACYAVLDPRTGELAYTLAGHPPPFVLRPRGVDPPRTGPPLGVDPAAAYGRDAVRLDHGDTLVLFTDGITEARDAAGRLYGEERLRECVARAAGASPERIRDAVLEDLRRFTGGAPTADDVTLVVVQLAS